MCLLIKNPLFKKGGALKTSKAKNFQKTIIKPKNEILRYNVSAIFIFRF